MKQPRSLFQTWHGRPDVSLNQQFIWALHFSVKKGYYSFFLGLVYLALES